MSCTNMWLLLRPLLPLLADFGRLSIILFCCLNLHPPTVEPSSEFDRLTFQNNINKPIEDASDAVDDNLDGSSDSRPTDSSDSFGWSIANNVVDFDLDFSSDESGIRVVEIQDILREKLLLKFPRVRREEEEGEEEAEGAAGGENDNGVGREGGAQPAGSESQTSNFSLELIRFTYLPMVFSRGVRQRVALSAQHLNVGSRIDFNVTSDVDSKTTCLGDGGCVYDRLVSFAFDDTRSPIRWPSQLRAAFNPLSVFPSDSRIVKVELCANREAWRLWQGYVPCVSALLHPWFWTSLSEKSQWDEALNCRSSSSSSSNSDAAGGDHFCCICAPDAGDGAPLCGSDSRSESLDLGAQVKQFATESRCTRDRRLGPRGTFGVCPYKCACGRAEVMRSRCRMSLKEELTDEWTAKLLKEARRDEEEESLLEFSGRGENIKSGTTSIMIVSFRNILPSFVTIYFVIVNAINPWI